MSSLDAMFEASLVYFQFVNKRSALVKIDRGMFPVGVNLGQSKSLISLYVRWLSTIGLCE